MTIFTDLVLAVEVGMVLAIFLLFIRLSNIIDISSMLWEEKEFYYALLKTLDTFRQGIIWQLFQGEPPNLTIIPTIPKPQFIAEHKDILESDEEISLESPKEKITQISFIQKTRIRFLHPTPSFIWKDLKVYGPFEKGNETEIFPEVAELLVRKGRAEKV